MDFEDALVLLKKGIPMRRELWHEGVGVQFSKDNGDLEVVRLECIPYQQYPLKLDDVEAGDWEVLT